MRFRSKISVIFFVSLLFAMPYFYQVVKTQAQADQQKPSPNPQAKQFPTNVNLECSGCHGAGKTLPYTAGVEFHKDAHGALNNSIHAQKDANGKPAASCKDCHTVGGDMTTALPAENPQSTVNAANLTKTCGTCHQESVATFHNSIHGSLVDKGDLKAATCADCHGTHNILPHTDPNSVLSEKNLQNVCAKCHTDVVPDFEQSSHAAALRDKKENAPSCTTCHTGVSHHNAPVSKRDFNLQMIDNCSKCHEKQAPSYRDTFHGQATALGFKPAATCADCHTPHKNLPAGNPLSAVHKDNLVQTCSKCHENVNANFAAYNPHPEPDNIEKSALVYYVTKFMTFLLMGVFTFFGIHTFLWLQRSLIAFFTEKHERTPEDDQYVIRFSKTHRLTHVLIVISFLGLAATGLPLMYYYTAWGKWLVAMHGGLEVTRFLHRVCAVITLLYALIHVFFVIKKAIIERKFSILYGPDSMTVRPKDFSDLIGMFRWFLYLGPRPKLDRWTYWEKFDYFAVFWGVPVIGLSGLVLWFPGFFSRFLPGDFLNAAVIIHSEEALLATAFIFAFHFFHNHLRPENFPMDTVIFTGKMTLAKFKEERPVEYERMVSEGTLDEILTTPPTTKAIIISKIFGFIAYITGLLLVFGIFATLLAGRH